MAIVGMLAFGGGQYFTRKATAVTYFEGSLAGLAVDADRLPQVLLPRKTPNCTEAVSEFSGLSES